MTKDEVLEVIKEWKSGRKEDLTMAVVSIPNVKVKRSKKIGMVHETRGEEWCPHCQKKLRFYDVVNPPPKYCYCMWCGGALERKKGNKNPMFDYNLIKDRPPVENAYDIMPTEGQIRFARAISHLLGIPLPNPRNSKNYWKFIHENQNEYYKAVQSGAAPKPMQKAEKKLSEPVVEDRKAESAEDPKETHDTTCAREEFRENAVKPEPVYRIPDMWEGEG